MRFVHQFGASRHFAVLLDGATMDDMATALDLTPTGSIARVGRRTARYRRILLVLAAGGLANFAVVYFPQPLLPQLATAFSVEPAATGLALSVATGAMLLGLIVAAPLSDRIGRVPAMGGSLVVAGLFCALGAAAPTWEAFLALRAGAGFTLAVLPAVALAYLRDVVHDDAQLEANSIYISGTALGGALGRLAPLPLAALGGWQLVMVVLGALSVAVGVIVWTMLPRDAAEHRTLRVGDVLGGALSSLRDPVILALCVVGGLNMALFVGLYNAVPFRLDAPPFSLGAAEVLVYLAYPIGIAAPGVFRRIAARRGRGAATLVGACALLFATAVLWMPSVVAVFVGLGILTFAFLGAHSILSGWVVERAHAVGRSTARASSAYLLVYYLGSTLSGTASTHVWQSGGWDAVIALAAAIGVCGLVLAIVVRRRTARTARTVGRGARAGRR